MIGRGQARGVWDGRVVEIVKRGSVIWKGEWTASSKIKRGNEYIWSGFVKAPFSGAWNWPCAVRVAFTGPLAIIVINHLVARCCLLACSRAASWPCGCPGRRARLAHRLAPSPEKAIVSLSVRGSGGLIVMHARIKGGRLTVTPGRSDRAAHSRIVGTQRARQDPTMAGA